MRNSALGTLVVLLIAAAAPATVEAAQPGARVQYIGGTRPEIPASANGTLQAIDEQYLVFYAKQANLRIAYEQINLIEYGQKVDRRYAMAVLISPLFVLSKKRQHFLTVGYIDPGGREQALIFKVEKSDVRAMLVSLEARTGRRVQFQDEEARKAGKG